MRKIKEEGNLITLELTKDEALHISLSLGRNTEFWKRQKDQFMVDASNEFDTQYLNVVYGANL